MAHFGGHWRLNEATISDFNGFPETRKHTGLHRKKIVLKSVHSTLA